MITWKSLLRRIHEHWSLHDNHRLIIQLLIRLKVHYPNIDMEEIFEEIRQQVDNSPTDYYRQLFPKGDK